MSRNLPSEISEKFIRLVTSDSWMLAAIYRMAGREGWTETDMLKMMVVELNERMRAVEADYLRLIQTQPFVIETLKDREQ